MTIYTAGTLIADQFEVIQGPRERPRLAGGMGLVYLCYDRETGVPLAVKTLKDELFAGKATRDRFVQEATTWINLGKHRNIVEAYFVRTIKGKPHIFLEYISGPPGYGSDLRSWLRRGRLDLVTALDFAIQICLGMEYAQNRIPGLVHRDIKPENVLIARDKTAKVTDFGLVQVLGAEAADVFAGGSDKITTHHASLTQVGSVLGTPPYMSPEQCRGERVDVRSDVYAFGCILYEMLAGRWVFQARTGREFIRCHLSQTPMAPSGLVVSLPEALDRVVMRCLEKEPDKRYESFGTLMGELVKVYETITGESPKPGLQAASLEALDQHDLSIRGISLHTLGKLKEAIEYLDRALRIDPTDADIWAYKGYVLNDLEHYEAAIDCTDRALEIDPNCAMAWTNKGNALWGLGQYAEAIACFDRALEIDQGGWVVIPLSNKANVLHLLGRKQEAMALYDQALAIDSVGDDAVEPWYNKGVLLLELERWEEALSCFERALEINPTRTDAWTNKGSVLLKQSRMEEAISCFETALEFNPQLANPWFGKAQALEAMQRFDEAVACYDAILQFDPKSVGAWSHKGHALIGLARFEEAIACLDQAIRIDGNNPELWSYKGTVFFAQGDLQRALECAEEALRIDPSVPQARKLARLVQKRNLVRDLVELGRQETFTIPDDIFDQVDEDFFAALKVEALYLRSKGNHKAADWLETDVGPHLVMMKFLGFGGGRNR